MDDQNVRKVVPESSTSTSVEENLLCWNGTRLWLWGKRTWNIIVYWMDANVESTLCVQHLVIVSFAGGFGVSKWLVVIYCLRHRLLGDSRAVHALHGPVLRGWSDHVCFRSLGQNWIIPCRQGLCVVYESLLIVIRVTFVSSRLGWLLFPDQTKTYVRSRILNLTTSDVHNRVSITI